MTEDPLNLLREGLDAAHAKLADLQGAVTNLSNAFAGHTEATVMAVRAENSDLAKRVTDLERLVTHSSDQLKVHASNVETQAQTVKSATEHVHSVVNAAVANVTRRADELEKHLNDLESRIPHG